MAAPIAPQQYAQDLAEAQAILECPFELTSLETGVSLIPCSHNVMESVAERMFGLMHELLCEKQGTPCPSCREPIRAYYPDHNIRSLATIFTKWTVAIPTPETFMTFVSEMQEVLDCPINLELLKTAVSLVPCSHNLTESIAKEMLGPMQKILCQKQGVPCPSCREPIKAYYPDHNIRSLALIFAKWAVEPQILQIINVEKEEAPLASPRHEEPGCCLFPCL